MKRFDTFVKMEHKVTHVVSYQKEMGSAIFGMTLSEAVSFYGTDNYVYYVKCRDCGNVHQHDQMCGVCDLSTKAR